MPASCILQYIHICILRICKQGMRFQNTGRTGTSVVDPNPYLKESTSFIRIRIQTLLSKENFCEESQFRFLKEKKTFYFYWKTFILSYRFQNTYDSNERHYLEKFGVKILVLGSVSESLFLTKNLCKKT
jgi:hypothetical protein